jgi:hypothetical protein
VPESYGKRQRDRVKAQKAAAKEGRRLARQQRQRDRAAGEEDPQSWLATPEEAEAQRSGIPPRRSTSQEPEPAPEPDADSAGSGGA